MTRLRDLSDAAQLTFIPKKRWKNKRQKIYAKKTGNIQMIKKCRNKRVLG